MDKITVNCDGGSRGNPGPAAIGVVIKDTGGKAIHKISQKIGIATNNVAEYSAVLAALEWIGKNHSLADLEFNLDSELIVKQLKGEYKIKDLKLKKLYYALREKILIMGREPRFNHISREKNHEADLLVNQALDK